MRRVVPWFLLCVLCAAAMMLAAPGHADEPSGLAAKRPVIAGACRTCVWGPLAEFVADALRPGYDVQVCHNCNLSDSPRYVAYARVPPPLGPENLELGDPPPPRGPVDFGVTEANFLQWLYEGKSLYRKDGPQKQLRLLALIEDPVYVLVAVKAESGITDLSQVRARYPAVRVMTEGDMWVEPILRRYHLTRREVEASGGKFLDAMALHKAPDFDVLISSLGSLAGNEESNVWYQMSQKYQLHFIELPREVLTEITSLGGEIVQMPVGYMRGVDKPVTTAGRSGHAIFARADLPADFAYEVARAIDEHQGKLKWLIRPFSYDRHTVYRDGIVPLHPGAEKYYREVGYLR